MDLTQPSTLLMQNQSTKSGHFDLLCENTCIKRRNDSIEGGF